MRANDQFAASKDDGPSIASSAAVWSDPLPAFTEPAWVASSSTVGRWGDFAFASADANSDCAGEHRRRRPRRCRSVSNDASKSSFHCGDVGDASEPQ